jgi:hypothetical protein
LLPLGFPVGFTGFHLRFAFKFFTLSCSHTCRTPCLTGILHVFDSWNRGKPQKTKVTACTCSRVSPQTVTGLSFLIHRASQYPRIASLSSFESGFDTSYYLSPEDHVALFQSLLIILFHTLASASMVTILQRSIIPSQLIPA